MCLESEDAMNPILAKTATFQQGDTFRLQDVSVVGTEKDDAIVQIELCTICGSDLHTIEGRRTLHGDAVLGHEIIGRVVWLPERPVYCADESQLQVGDRITWSIHASCGQCFYCQNDLSQKCEQLFKYGHQAISASHPCTGGFATHCQIRTGTSIVRLPEDLDARIIAPANCATATVVAAFRKAGDCNSRHVLVLGAGMLGLTAVAYAHANGAASVAMIDPNEERANRALDFGATAVCTDLATANRKTIELTEGRGADMAFDFAGKPDAVLSSIHFVRIGGCAVLCGSVFPTESISLSPEMVVRRMLTIRGVHNYAAQDLVKAVSFLSTKGASYPFISLVSEPFALDEIQTAVQAASAGKSVRVAIAPMPSG